MEDGTNANSSTPSTPSALSAETVLRHLRQTVIVIDEDGTVLQHLGSSLGVLGYSAAELVGTNALEHVAPEHYDAMLFAFFGPDDRIVRSKHLPFKVGLLDRHGETHYADCCGERISVDGQHRWIVTMMPHQLQSASSHALQAYGNGASSLEVAETVAKSLAMDWDDAYEIRSFLLFGHDGYRFTSASEPGRSLESGLGAQIASFVGAAAPWNSDTSDVHIVLPVGELPGEIAQEARAAGFAVADLAVANLSGEPMLALLTFAIHEHTFAGNIDMILRDSIKTIEMTLLRERNDEILRFAAEQDPLTGLANRARFSDALEQSTASTSVLFIDLDEFKQVNDTYGHVVGDAVLVEVARRISEVCRPGDVVARMGGDEFAILLKDVETAGSRRISERIIEAIAEPLPLGLGPVHVSASGGLTSVASGSMDCVERADLAMLRGKRSGSGQLVVV